MNLETGLTLSILLFALAIWSIVWKGVALWIAAKEDQKYWFIALLVLNTAGILEIIYIFFFSATGKRYIDGWKKHRTNQKTTKKKSKQSSVKKEKKNQIEEEV